MQPAGDSRVIVNETFARRYFPGEPALGRRFSYTNSKNALVAQEIIGVARDAKYSSVREAAPPTVYLPQWSPGWGAIQMRSSLDYAAVAALLGDELSRAHPSFRLTDMTLQSTLVSNVIVRERVLALLSAFFVLVAIILVAVGLYGVLSYSVVARTREIGIRLALGARPLRVMQLVVREIWLVMAIGIALGVAGGITASRFTTAMLYQVKPSDFWSLGLPLVCLLVTCALAASLPALRATRVDPMTALRGD